MNDLINESKIKEIIFYITVTIVIIIILLVIYFTTGFKFIDTQKEISTTGRIISQNEDDILQIITVEIRGAVLNPGIYELNKNSKLNDLIILSGGLLKNANQSIINRMDVLKDGDRVIIPFRFDFNEYQKDPHTITRDDIGYEYEKVTNVIYRRPSVKNSSSTKININTAGKEELMTLSGIGAATAENIIEYRTNNLFENIEDIMNVPRIGPKTFENLKENIIVR